MKRAALALLAFAFGTAASATEYHGHKIARGAYLARIMDCAGCHTPRGPDGAPIHEAGLSGGTLGFEIPGLGTFWPPNLTPDETGLGGWTRDQIIAAIREGRRPDGRMLAPAMPWQQYSGLTDADADALASYLMSVKAVDHAVPLPAEAGEAAAAPFYRVVLPDWSEPARAGSGPEP